MEKRLNDLLRAALAYHVTDIHFTLSETYENKVLIEMRIGGVMRKVRAENSDERFFRYLMYRANLDVSNVLMPQTGSFEQIVDQQRLSLRFALVSSYHRTSGVLRILNNHPTLIIDELTAQKRVLHWLHRITLHHSGLFIFSGPTGSGKTTSLYTILNACEGKKIFTLEDPVEIVNEKYVQLQVNEKQHLSYADGIRQLMRHDPDILMIGEIRDESAAQMAVRSALTGHLVVTSLHSSSCTSAIQRMMDLGVPRYQLEDVLAGISSQRLFERADGSRTGIYEIMDRKELSFYFTQGHTSKLFRTLAQEIEEAVRFGILTEDQAAGYLPE